MQHYTGQLAKDTARHLGELSASPSVADNRQWRLQNDRLKDSFTKALNNFQVSRGGGGGLSVVHCCPLIPVHDQLGQQVRLRVTSYDLFTILRAL